MRVEARTHGVVEMTEFDRHRLMALLDRVRREHPNPDGEWHQFQALRHKLETAWCVDPAEVARTVVTMGSTVRFRELDSGEWWTFTLCYPNEARIDEGRISVLAPLGMAILGQRVGDVVDWPIPRGCVRIRICKLTYQPEAAGVLNEPELVLR